MPYIYVLSNEAMPGLLKIGCTAFAPEERARQLSTTGVPQPFKVEEYWELNCEDILVIERKIHAHLKKWRYAKNREFFGISVNVAVDEINGFFDLQGKLQKEKEEKARIDKERKENLEKVADLRRQLDAIVMRQREDVVSAFKRNSQNLIEYLNKVAHPHMAATIIRQHRSDESRGKLQEVFGWFVGVEERRRGSRKRGVVDDYGEIVRFSVSTSFSAFMRGIDAAPHYVSISYFLRTGDRDDKCGDSKIINRHFGRDVFPDSLGRLLNQVGVKDIYDVWVSAYGQASKLKKIVDESSACPVCLDGRLLKRTRRKDGYPFLGCSNFPNCRFAYNYSPMFEASDWGMGLVGSMEKMEKPKETKVNVDKLDDLNDLFGRG